MTSTIHSSVLAGWYYIHFLARHLLPLIVEETNCYHQPSSTISFWWSHLWKNEKQQENTYQRCQPFVLRGDACCCQTGMGLSQKIQKVILHDKDSLEYEPSDTTPQHHIMQSRPHVHSQMSHYLVGKIPQSPRLVCCKVSSYPLLICHH